MSPPSSPEGASAPQTSGSTSAPAPAPPESFLDPYDEDFTDDSDDFGPNLPGGETILLFQDENCSET